MSTRARPWLMIPVILYAGALAGFYIKYIPLTVTYQAVLGPILLLALGLTLTREEAGILFFVFAFPLINNLPSLCGLADDLPQAPPALALFLFFFLGWSLRRTWTSAETPRRHTVFRPMVWLSLLVVVSGLIAALRYANFFPFLADGIRELIVNNNGTRAGGALMSTVFTSLDYLTGFVWFTILISAIQTTTFLKKTIHVLAGAALLALGFSLFQVFFAPGLGNTAYFVNLERINGTFKDPNSLAAFLAATTPLFLGFALIRGERPTLIPLLATGVALVVLPLTGSRTGFLALFLSLILMAILSIGRRPASRRKKILESMAVIAAMILAAFVVMLISHNSILVQRLSPGGSFFKTNSLRSGIEPRLDYWQAAARMMGDYPLTGVGVGAFIIELPNVFARTHVHLIQTDSALNYLLQVGSEIGLPGIVLAGWLFWEIVREMRRKWQRVRAGSKESFIILGACAGLATFAVDYLFHTYIASYEVRYTFWLLAALVFSAAELPEEERARERRTPLAFVIPAAAFLAAFGGLFLWHSTHRLSISALTREFGWKQDFGLYPAEPENTVRSFRWTGGTAGLTLACDGESLVIPMRASHPDMGTRPVTTRIFLADSYFRKVRLLEEVTFRNSAWRRVSLPCGLSPVRELKLRFETDRTWCPEKALGAADSRDLAVALGEPILLPNPLPRQKPTMTVVRWLRYEPPGA